MATKKSPYYILHGYNGHANENWFPWLKAELEKRGEEVVVPDFPEAGFPALEKWLTLLKDEVKKHGEGVLIGHSLGGALAMRYLESGGHPKKIVLAAAPFGELPEFPQINGFLSKPFVLSNKQIFDTEFLIFYTASDDDPYVPPEHVQDWAKLTGVKPILLENKGHFNQETFPEILDYL
ncbi:hypothetical protein A2V68_02390 [candidate division Kazan bacterium RBG_13_50_9]|uniref:Alpha/beta hydrolase n=1 Tax=candidate division Kazan bacterium RBG_13_50_9 TaxID=1798535 RepID=A0A1F4NS04_UNCK3|nr:MAG: hypothetical protein A2V68_02390 [candidate division Kazan bacterium RBG_13_50_9]